VKMRKKNEVHRRQIANLHGRICQAFRVQPWTKVYFLMHMDKGRIGEKRKTCPSNKQGCISYINIEPLVKLVESSGRDDDSNISLGDEDDDDDDIDMKLPRCTAILRVNIIFQMLW
jgi:hypothetical protein